MKCSYKSLPEIFYTKINPNLVSAPKLVVLKENLANGLGMKFFMVGSCLLRHILGINLALHSDGVERTALIEQQMQEQLFQLCLENIQ